MISFCHEISQGRSVYINLAESPEDEVQLSDLRGHLRVLCKITDNTGLYLVGQESVRGRLMLVTHLQKSIKLSDGEMDVLLQLATKRLNGSSVIA